MNEQTRWIWLYLNAKGCRIETHDQYVNLYDGSEPLLTYDCSCGTIEFDVKEIDFVVMKAFMEVVTCY